MCSLHKLILVQMAVAPSKGSASNGICHNCKQKFTTTSEIVLYDHRDKQIKICGLVKQKYFSVSTYSSTRLIVILLIYLTRLTHQQKDAVNVPLALHVLYLRFSTLGHVWNCFFVVFDFVLRLGCAETLLCRTC